MLRLVPWMLVAALVFPSATRAEDPDFKKLVEIAKRYEIPMPPKEAKLVLAHTGGTMVLGNSSTNRDPGIYSPAFLLSTADGTTMLLRGTLKEPLRERGRINTREFDLERVERKLGGFVPEFDRASSIICAVQLAERGELETATALWTKCHSGRGI